MPDLLIEHAFQRTVFKVKKCPPSNLLCCGCTPFLPYLRCCREYVGTGLFSGSDRTIVVEAYCRAVSRYLTATLGLRKSISVCQNSLDSKIVVEGLIRRSDCLVTQRFFVWPSAQSFSNIADKHIFLLVFERLLIKMLFAALLFCN